MISRRSRIGVIAAPARHRPHLTLTIGLVLIALGGCRDTDGVTAPTIGGRSAGAPTYAFATPYGEMYEANSEVFPAGYGEPWDALVTGQQSTINYSCSSIACNVSYRASHNGVWSATSIDLNWGFNGAGSKITNSGIGTCPIWLGPLNCLIRTFSSDYQLHTTTHCNWQATLRADHSAWWASFFDLTDLTMRYGQFGKVTEGSHASPVSGPACQVDGGGGDPIPEDMVCYDVFLVWQLYEEYLGKKCFRQFEM